MVPNDKKMEKNEELVKGIHKIMAVVENYPNLKANENFQDLSHKLTKLEEDIANARKYYNGVVDYGIIRQKCFQVI